MTLLKVTLSLDPAMYGNGPKLDAGNIAATYPKE